MINGTDAFTKQSGVGLQPVFSWSPPTLGAATGYQVYLYPASLVDQTVANGFTARVYGTTFRTPPGLLKSGISYLAVITSYQGRQFTLDQNPWVIGYPYYSADCVSAIFTP